MSLEALSPTSGGGSDAPALNDIADVGDGMEPQPPVRQDTASSVEIDFDVHLTPVEPNDPQLDFLVEMGFARDAAKV